jgi:hypothetical protein
MRFFAATFRRAMQPDKTARALLFVGSTSSRTFDSAGPGGDWIPIQLCRAAKAAVLPRRSKIPEEQTMLTRTRGLNARLGICIAALGACFGACALNGCDRKERVVDVQTPIGDVKVDKDKVDGDVEVKVDTD